STTSTTATTVTSTSLPNTTTTTIPTSWGCGTFLTTWGSAGCGNGQFDGPQGVATDGSGNVYVADTGNYGIETFDIKATFLTTWGSSPTRRCSDLSTTSTTAATVTTTSLPNTTTTPIPTSWSCGTFLTTWGSAGLGNGQFESPTGVATDGSGNVQVADYG